MGGAGHRCLLQQSEGNSEALRPASGPPRCRAWPVDDLARFVNPTTVVLCDAADPADDATLRSAGLKVVKLPMPRPLWFDGRQLPASYANFYIANGLVLVPTFNDPSDRAALTTLARQFPGREVVGINCTELVWGLGALHCMTQQQPA